MKNETILLIKSGQLKEAIEKMLDYFNDNSQEYKSLILLSNNQRELALKIRNSTMSEEDIIVQKNKIITSILEILFDVFPEVNKNILQLEKKISTLNKEINRLKKEKSKLLTDKDLLAMELHKTTLSLSPSINSGMEQINSSIIPYYLELVVITLSDLKASMEEILHQISLTTIIPDNKNLARIGLFEVIPNGKFRVLATHQIQSRRIVDLEEKFSHSKENPIGIVGHCISDNKIIFESNLRESRYASMYYLTEHNRRKRRYEAEGIICIPIKLNDKTLQNNGKANLVLSVSVSESNFLNEKHKSDLMKYCETIEYIYKGLKKRILYDPKSLEIVKGITISGEAGVGKSSLLDRLYDDSLMLHGWQKFKIGDLFRPFCELKEIHSPYEVEYLHDDLHREFDIYQKNILYEHNGILMESRFSGMFAKSKDEIAKKTLRIFLKCPKTSRIERYAEKYKLPLSKASEKVTELDRINLERSKRLYSKDYRDEEIYDLILDAKASPKELANQIMIEIKKRTN